MLMTSTIELYAGGTGSGCNPNKGKCGRPATGKTKKLSDRAQRALETYVPITAEKRKQSEADEMALAKLIGGQRTPDNSAFDVIKGKTAIEIKSIIAAKNDKITMHPTSRNEKLAVAKKQKLNAFTVVFDHREGRNDVYYREGVGSFKLRDMTKLKNIGGLKRVL